MDYSDLTIVIPTLNEEESIGRLISKLTGSYDGIRVIVSDDGSDDGTERVVGRLSRRNGNVKFLDRSKRPDKGLTASAIEGILDAKTKYVIVMDADLQHPPQTVGRIKRGLDSGNGVVVAVRKSVTGWQLYRRIVSRSLILVGYAVLLAGRRERCGDIFSGFFGVDRKLFSKVYGRNRNRFVGEGYKILFDLLKCIDRGSVKVSEVPYAFHVREAGSSKAGVRQAAALLRSFLS